MKGLLDVGKEIIVEPGVEGSEYDKYEYLLTFMKNVIWFNSIKDAEQAGYHASKE